MGSPDLNSRPDEIKGHWYTKGARCARDPHTFLTHEMSFRLHLDFDKTVSVVPYDNLVNLSRISE